MREKAERASKLLDEIRCVLDAYPWSCHHKSMRLGQLLLENEPRRFERDVHTMQHSAQQHATAGATATSRMWMMDHGAEAWPHARHHLLLRFWRRARLQAALPLYRAWAASPVQRRLLLQYLRVKNRAGKLQRRIWCAWVCRVAVCRSIMQVLQCSLVRKLTRVTCRGALRAWQHSAVLERTRGWQQQHAQLLAAFQAFQLHVCVQNQSRQLLLDAALRSRPAQKTRSFLGAWIWENSTRQHLLHTMHVVARRVLEGLVRRTLGAWRQDVMLRKLLAHRLSFALAQGRKRKLIHGMYAWAIYTGKEQRLRALILRRAQGSLLLAFSPWAQHAYSEASARHRMTRIIKRLGNRVLVQAFATWKEQRLSHHRTSALHLVVSRMKNRGLVLGFQVWHHRVQELIIMRKKAATVVTRLKMHGLLLAFDAFQTQARKQVRQRQHCRLLLDKMMLQSMVGAWNCWQDTLQHRMSTMRALAAPVSRLLHRCLHESLVLWVKATSLRRLSIKSLLRWRHHTLLKALQAWRVLAAEERRLQQLTHKAIMRLFKRGIAMVFDAWRHFCLQQRITRPILCNIARRMLLRLAHVAFSTWKEERLKRHRAGGLEHVVGGMRQRILAMAFDELVQSLQHHRSTMRRAVRVEQRHTRRHLCCAFEAWRVKVLQLCSYKRKTAKGRWRRERARLYRGMVSWSHGARLLASLRFSCSLLTFKRTGRLLVDISSAWCWYTQRKRGLEYKLSQVSCAVTSCTPLFLYTPVCAWQLSTVFDTVFDTVKHLHMPRQGRRQKTSDSSVDKHTQVSARWRKAQGWRVMSEWGMASRCRARFRRRELALTVGRSCLVSLTACACAQGHTRLCSRPCLHAHAW